MKKYIISFLLFILQSIGAPVAASSFYLKTNEVNSHTITFYQFVNVSNGICTPAANQLLTVTFNDDGSITTANRQWSYCNKIGLLGHAGWINGADYITITEDYSQLQYNHQELIGGLVYFVSSFIVFSSHENSQEEMLAYCNFLNSCNQQGYSGGNNGGNTYNQPSRGKRCTKTHASDTYHCGGNGVCARCNGRGWYTDYSYGKKKSYICPNCHGTKNCPACNGTGFR